MHQALGPGAHVGVGGRYLIERVLGAGAFGEVFLGRDLRLHNRRVAIKHLLPAARQQRDSWLRFVQEARILSELNHPNIIGIFDIDEEHDCIVLEFAAGGTLASVLDEQKRVAPARGVEIAIAVLDALHAVHAKCIWHRDLKPANILLDDAARVKVSDFGIAHAPDGAMYKLAHTAFGQPGTPLYMSPEQIRGQPIDGRSDVWAVGVILYQLVTGFFHLPFYTLDNLPAHEAFAKLREMIVERKPRPPSSFNPALPLALDQAILRALEANPDGRYQSAREMMGALRRVLRQLPDPSDSTVPAQTPAPTVYAAPAFVNAPAEREAAAVVPAEAAETPVYVAFRAEAPEPPPRARVEPPPPAPPEPIAPAPSVKHAVEDRASDPGSERVDAARALLKEGKAQAAIDLIAPIAEVPDAPAEAARVLAEACVHVRAYARALAAAERACTARGARPESWLLRGMCLVRMGRAIEAAAVYREGCATHAKDASLHEALGVALRNQGRGEEAIRVLEEAAELDPARASVQRLLKAWRSG